MRLLRDKIHSGYVHIPRDNKFTPKGPHVSRYNSNYNNRSNYYNIQMMVVVYIHQLIIEILVNHLLLLHNLVLVHLR